MDVIRCLDKSAVHWNTPYEVWELIEDYLPRGENDVIWEPFYNETSKSAQYLRELGCKVVSGNVDFYHQTVPLGSHIVTNPPFDKKEDVIAHLAKLDCAFILILPIHSLCTRFIKNHFKNKLQLLIPDMRIHFSKKDRKTGEIITLKRTPFDSVFYCYKMNLEHDLIWL